MIEANKNCYGDGLLYEDGEVISPCRCELSPNQSIIDIGLGSNDLPELEHGVLLLDDMKASSKLHWRVVIEDKLKELRASS